MNRAAPAQIDQLLEHAGWIRALALQLVRDTAAVDDVVQETLLAALRRPPSADRPLRPWLARVTRNQAALAARGDRRRSEREHGAARTEALPSAADLTERAEQQKRLVEAVLALDEPYRATLLLRYYEGLEPEVIAARQGTPGSTVRNRIARGLEQLRERLDAQHGGDRRAWSLMLVPLAVEAKSHAAAAGAFSAIAGGLVAMQVVTKLVLTLCLITLVAGLAFFGCESRVEPNPVAAVPVREDVEPFSLGERLEVANDDQPRAEAFEPRDELPIADRPVAPTMSLRVRGSVNDLDRKVGLADFELVIDDGVREPETLVTDAEGRFASALDYAAGELAITLLDRAGTESLEFFDGGFVREVPPVVELVTWSPGEELKLSAAVGRSVSVTVQGRSPAPPPWFASVESDSLCWRNASVQFERAPVRAGSSPWFRLAARSLKRVASADRLTVSLTSDDGLWYGVGTVRETSALVKIESRARLDVELSRSDGEPIVSPDIEVRAVDTDCILRADSRWDGSRVVRGESPTRFVFRALERGEYDVVARARGCPPVSKRVKLLNGKVTLAKLVLGPSRGASSIRGELRSNTGDFATAVTVSITSLEERDARPLTQRCEFRRERGEMVAAFDFAGVAPGKYAIQLVKNGARHERWLPTPTTVDAPADGLVFVCQDDETLIDLRLRALQFDTDGPLGIARWRYVIDGVPFSGQGPELVIEGVSPRSAFEWCVTAQGFGVVCGDWDEFFPAGKESFCEARLRRGWGAKIRTVDDRTRVPVADVGIWLDGELAGHTDDDGVLLVDRRERPNRLEAGLAGWRLTSEARKLGVVVDDEARMVLVLPMSPQL